MKDRKHETLGENVIPSNYSLTFNTDLKTFRYSGTARIKVVVKKPTKIIKLNAVGLNIKAAKIISRNGVQDAKSKLITKEGRLELSFGKEATGFVTIEIEFSGINNDKMYGFYRSSYTYKGKMNYILTTQFEPADARAAFPCFDEPEFKATFDVTLIINNNLKAISNMPIKGVKKIGNRKAVTFNTTPKMSTYLLYLGVGKYDQLSTKLNKLKINLITTPGKKNLAKLSLEYGKKFVTYYENYFGIKYPLPKLDLIAIPDFAAGAMENWGAITFRETDLLGNESSPLAQKQRKAMIVAHELVHQWFGDLVTMKWWDDLWLNESFADFLSYKAMDEIFPEWQIRAMYLDDIIGTAFEADQLKSTHPISVPVDNPEQINSIFDRISYEKGGTVLYMLECYVGAETFRAGLHDYLKEHKYSNATKYDMFDQIDRQAKRIRKDFKALDLARAWIEKTGYPIVEVAKVQNKFKLTQKRFTITNLKSSDIWPIPIHYVRTDDLKEQSFLMNRKSLSIMAENSSWIKLNYRQNYLYRVKYTTDLLNQLGNLIKTKKLEGLDVWGIVNDLFVLVEKGEIVIEDYLDFVKNYCIKVDYPANLVIAGHLGWLYLMLYKTEKFELLRKVAIKYFDYSISKIGWKTLPNEPATTTLYRGVVIRSLGMLGDIKVINKANMLFENFIENGEVIDPNIRTAVYLLAAWNGNKKTFNEFINRYKKETFPEERIRLLQSLGMFNNEELAKKALDFSLSKEVKFQDSPAISGITTINPTGRKYMWQWTRENWHRLVKRYSSGTHLLRHYAGNLGSESTPTKKEEIERFFSNKQNMREDIKRVVSQTLEHVDVNINFMRKNNLL